MADHRFSKASRLRLIGVNGSAWQYEPLRGQDDAVRLRIREIERREPLCTVVSDNGTELTSHAVLA